MLCLTAASQNLQRDCAVQFCILSEIDFSHSARADLRANFVTSESCAGSKTHFFKSAIQLKITIGAVLLVRDYCSDQKTLAIRKSAEF